ncbi:MAG: Maf family protein [Acidobacteria bacterium]|nr:Maf family protein [Acidobacteriota bacterium]MCI0568888.1 Maf family protein [Acidobacteriota bacterium]
MLPLDRPLLLASGSHRRADLLQKLGVHFTQQATNLPEEIRSDERPEQFVLRMALEKAQAGAVTAPPRSLVLGCDTVVVSGSRILGKPRDRAEGREMLHSLAGRSHLVLSGLALLLLPENYWASGVSETRVRFHPLPAAAVESYLDTGEYRDKAGAYALQGAAALFVDRIEGSATNVIGLPLDLFPRLLHQLGLWFPEA